MVPELMDQPGLDPEDHAKALAGLRRINLLSGSAEQLWPAIRKHAIRTQWDRPLRVLDVACGGGDLLLRLGQKAKRAGIPVNLAGCDMSTQALEISRVTLSRGGFSGEFHLCNVCEDPLPQGYDVITSSLFLHHLEEAQVVHVLSAMRESGADLLVLSDILRSRLGLALAHTVPKLLSRSPIVHTDAVLSVRASYTLEEIQRLAAAAALPHPRIRWSWPERFLLVWERGR
jgi:2-polyprenyl-3-methyl-5-hydroxy-6-metoxy-1,4-benzoquinol methylase